MAVSDKIVRHSFPTYFMKKKSQTSNKQEPIQSGRTEKTIPVHRVFLDQENPRHEPYETESQVIDYLCKNEEVRPLAHDIVSYGLSPLDRFGVRSVHDTEDDQENYIVAEGNRRLCALKLLTDPDLAPSKHRKYFKNLANSWTPITEISCVIFSDQKDLNRWLERRHHGLAGGIGQKAWNADQKARHSRDQENRIPLAFLDYAEKEGIITAEQRKRRLTTVRRFLSNPLMRENLGLDASNPDEVCRIRPAEDFRLLSKKFIADMLSPNPKVTSRKDKQYIDGYARELSASTVPNRVIIEPEPIKTGPDKPRPAKPTRPRRPQQRTKLPHQQNIQKELESLGNWKLESLYHSICSVSLQANTPLLAIGVWAFIETLTAYAGRKSKINFHAFLSIDRLTRYELGDKQRIKPVRDALHRIMNYGNTTKHHDTAATFNGEQLANDMDCLGEVILKLIEEAQVNE